MSECEHKYKWDIMLGDAWFYCVHCKQAAGALEIEAALNEHADLKEENKGLRELIKEVLEWTDGSVKSYLKLHSRVARG